MSQSTGRPKPRILFVHGTPLWYIMPYFVWLSEIHDVNFIFTDMGLGSRMYGVDTLAGEQSLDKIRYKVLKRYLQKISPSGIPLGLIKSLFLERYDIVVATLSTVEMLFCFAAAKLRRKPVVFWSGAWGWKGKSSDRNLASVFDKFIVPRSDAIIVPGSKHKEYLVSLGASPERVHIMPYASNIVATEEDYNKEEELKERLGIGMRKVILYVGRLVKQKGVDYLIRAFAELKKRRDDVVLVIVGDGESRSELGQLSKQLNVEDSVYFVGFIENLHLPSYYLLCDICVVPSITYGQADIWVRAVNDAMSAGKPVVATDAVGAAFDMVKNGLNGFMVPEKDVGALYRALEKIISDPELAEMMGKESKRILEEGFTYKHMVDGFGRAVESVSRRRQTDKG